MARSAGVQLEKVSEIAEKQTSASISILVFIIKSILGRNYAKIPILRN